jgi:hypothetical protein
MSKSNGKRKLLISDCEKRISEEQMGTFFVQGKIAKYFAPYVGREL